MGEVKRYIAKIQEEPKPHKTYIADEIVVRDEDYRALESENTQLRAGLTKLKQPVSDEEKIRSIALAAAREIAESFNISTPRGMSYHNGILHTIRIIIETHLRGESRESLLAARSKTESGK